MTWFGFGIFLLLSIPSLNSPSVHSHTLLPHLFHKASPVNPFITHSVIKSNLCLAGTDRHWNKTSKAQPLFSGHLKKEGKYLSNSCKSQCRRMGAWPKWCGDNGSVKGEEIKYLFWMVHNFSHLLRAHWRYQLIVLSTHSPNVAVLSSLKGPWGQTLCPILLFYLPNFPA